MGVQSLESELQRVPPVTLRPQENDPSRLWSHSTRVGKDEISHLTNQPDSGVQKDGKKLEQNTGNPGEAQAILVVPE